MSLRYASTAASSAGDQQLFGQDRHLDFAPRRAAARRVTMTTNVFLEFGRQKLRLSVLSGTPSLNWIELSPSTSAPVANGTRQAGEPGYGQAMTYDTTNFMWP